MIRNIDVILGVACWLFALFTYQQAYYAHSPFFSEHAPIVLYPPIWCIMLFFTMYFHRRPISKLWWVWFSAIPEFHFWWIFPIILLAKIFNI